MNERDELLMLRRIAELEAKSRGAQSRRQDQQESVDPTAGMGGLEKFGAGVGKAMVDTWRGIKQLATLNSPSAQKDVDDAKERDVALMNTGEGFAGNIAGNIATAIGPGAVLGAAGKASHIPALVNSARAITMPKTVLGAAGVGAGFGAIQPVASDESRITNMMAGGIGGAAVPAAISGGRLVRDTIAPFTQKGADKVAGRAIQRAAANPSALQGVQANQFVKGSSPTFAEASGDEGLAQLQRTLANQPDINPAFAARAEQNNIARAAALREIAGDNGKREFFNDAREANAQKLYEKAFGESAKLTPWVKGEISKLQARPAFRAAWKQADTIARNEGIKLDRKNVVQIAHYTKKALDDAASNATGNEQRAILTTRDKLLSLMESKDFAPSYREARLTYAADSAPINQMDVGQELYNKFVPALADYGATTRSKAATFTNALRDADATAARATGFKGAKMDRVLTPEQMALVQGVAKDLGRAARAQDVGRATGSNTAQNLIAQDVLRQTLGPIGLPSSWSENALAQTFMRPVSWATKIPEQKTLRSLAEAMLDPKEAKRLIALAEMSQRRGLLDRAAPYSVPIGTAGLLSLTE